MKFSMLHNNNINAFDLERSMKFYADALGLFEVGRIAPESGAFMSPSVYYCVSGRRVVRPQTGADQVAGPDRTV